MTTPTSAAAASVDPLEPARLYPTAMAPTVTPPAIPPDTDFSAHYAAGGYPDIEDAGLRYAAGQRAYARAQENRAALAAGATDDATSRAGNPQGPTAVGLAPMPPNSSG